LDFDPRSEGLSCPYCGTACQVARSEEEIEELDFQGVLDQAEEEQEVEDRLDSKCDACGASTTFEANVTSAECPFCGTNVVLAGRSTKIIKPRSVLPFKVEFNKATAKFRSWVKGRWFAPTKLKQLASVTGGISGVYIPYWTYDCATTSAYRGERGDNCEVREASAAIGRGPRVSRGKTATKIRWNAVRGSVHKTFDDVLVVGSESLPRRFADRLEPWDLENLAPYSDGFLSGFRAESYQIGLKPGFECARKVIDGRIRTAVREEIGGDHQRIHKVTTGYDAITFKHVLLPVWISAYRYQGKVYRFLINGRTGEVQGERPYSWIKIVLAILVGLSALTALIMMIT